MKVLRSTKAFTLIELLVVISIIGILAGFAIPAVSGALVRAQMAGTLSNARQLHLATFSINIENETAGLPGIWPGTPAVNNVGGTEDLNAYIAALGMNFNDLQRLLSAPKVTATVTSGAGNIATGASGTAFKFYEIGGPTVPDDGTLVFVSTQNITITPGVSTVDDTVNPYGAAGGVIFRKAGSGEALKKSIIENLQYQASIPTTQPATFF